jgi:transcriptional regulator with GAF, ATPase, and Fis domain
MDPTGRQLGPDSDPAAAIAAVIALRRLADQLERQAVERAIAAGWSWAQVAQALGVTRQAAHKKHARRLREAGHR